jgi:effector-binding domain-containing protein
VYDVSIASVPQRMALVAWRPATLDNTAEVIGAAFAELIEYVESGAVCGAEERLVLYPREWGGPGEHGIGVAVVISDGVPAPHLRMEELPGCKVVRTVYYGPYSEIRDGGGAVWEWMDEHGLEPANGCWELYLNSPDEVPECELATELLVPLP